MLRDGNARTDPMATDTPPETPIRWPRHAATVVPLVLLAAALLRLASLHRAVARARALAALGQPFERRLARSALRVLVGDSTGVGIGANRPEESIAGLLAEDFPAADIVNVSRSGARVADALMQARACRRSGLRFDVALLHIGGNDVLRATPMKKLAEDCELLLAELGEVADRTVWLGPPNLGIAPLFPPPFSWVFAARRAPRPRCSRVRRRLTASLFSTSLRASMRSASSAAAITSRSTGCIRTARATATATPRRAASSASSRARRVAPAPAARERPRRRGLH